MPLIQALFLNTDHCFTQKHDLNSRMNQYQSIRHLRHFCSRFLSEVSVVWEWISRLLILWVLSVCCSNYCFHSKGRTTCWTWPPCCRRTRGWVARSFWPLSWTAWSWPSPRSRETFTWMVTCPSLTERAGLSKQGRGQRQMVQESRKRCEEHCGEQSEVSVWFPTPCMCVKSPQTLTGV